MKKYLLMAFLLLFSAAGFAKPQIVGWTNPTTNCDGDSLTDADLISYEIAYSISPMPVPSDTGGSCDQSQPDPDVLTGATVATLSGPATNAILNLQPGQRYYVRIRVDAYIAGNWSSWSGEAAIDVPYGRPERVIISDGMYQIQYELITDPMLQIGWRKIS